ncbi:MAG TPA: bifunctional isocitrate dehydrogenase kinase/phosphatase [Acidimicrobiia bacterium]|nr:bifunctional isocitrate dehydrogenase kinase/phosphatase [Acidimicrobiia bacterium]
MTTPLTDSRLSNLGANRILEGFEEYVARFRTINQRARRRFEERDWPGMQSDTVERLRLYTVVVDRVMESVGHLLGRRADDPLVWVAVKAVYSGLIAERQDWELAETFYNSVTRRVFGTVGVAEHIEFVDSDFGTPPSPSTDPVYLTFDRRESTLRLVTDILTSFAHAVPYARLEADAAAVGARIDARLSEPGALATVGKAEVVRAVFYRGQSAYIVGLLYAGSHRIPLIIALSNGEDGVFVDAVLLTENEASIVFSFTRSYFHVDVARPYDLVRFLRRLMPRKRVAEIYIAIGQNKHGKTELYRDLLRHLRSTEEQFELAPGTRGMVMIVFTMPGYDDVFKVIRDTFLPPKRATRRSVMGKYRLVFQHDRAGRLMDVQDFQHLAFQRSKFSDAVLDELLTEAPGTVRLDGESVVISHVYVERRVVPLDIYVREAAAPAAADAVIDFGQAIKDLASTNIFPGDLLPKNFGVTRHGRVVFYDYDELSPLTEISFRQLPPPRDETEALASDPWFPVGDRDVFPEEHQRFLGLSQGLREVFFAHHADLFSVEAWQAMQERIRSGELIEVYPYRQDARLPGTGPSRGW